MNSSTALCSQVLQAALMSERAGKAGKSGCGEHVGCCCCCMATIGADYDDGDDDDDDAHDYWGVGWLVGWLVWCGVVWCVVV